MSNLVKYAEYSGQAADEEAQEMKRRSPYLKLPAGETIVRIPPPPLGRVTIKGLPTPYIKVSQHRVDVPGRQYPFKFPCPRVHHGKSCVCCREADRLRASAHKIDQDKAYKVAAHTRYYVEVIDRNDAAEGWKVWEFGPRMMEDLNTLRRNTRICPANLPGGYTNVDEGFDLIITRTGTGPQDTRYRVDADRDASPFGDMTLLDNRPDMEYFTRLVTEAEINDGVNGVEEQEDEGAAAAPRPAARQQPRPATVSSTATPTPARRATRTADDVIDSEVDDDELRF